MPRYFITYSIILKGMPERVIKKGLKTASNKDHFLLQSLFDRSFDSCVHV